VKISKKELEKFKNKLLELRSQHNQTLKGTVSDVMMPDEGKGASQHHADEGTDDFGRIISIEVTSKELGVLKQIDRALEKIEEGTYGTCDVSGDDISIKRLEAIPYATMTRESQEKLEKGQL